MGAFFVFVLFITSIYVCGNIFTNRPCLVWLGMLSLSTSVLCTFFSITNEPEIDKPIYSCRMWSTARDCLRKSTTECRCARNINLSILNLCITDGYLLLRQKQKPRYVWYTELFRFRCCWMSVHSKSSDEGKSCSCGCFGNVFISAKIRVISSLQCLMWWVRNIRRDIPFNRHQKFWYYVLYAIHTSIFRAQSAKNFCSGASWSDRGALCQSFLIKSCV